MKKIVLTHFDYPGDLLAYRGYLVGYHKMYLTPYLSTVMLNLESYRHILGIYKPPTVGAFLRVWFREGEGQC